MASSNQSSRDQIRELVAEVKSVSEDRDERRRQWEIEKQRENEFERKWDAVLNHYFGSRDEDVSDDQWLEKLPKKD